MIDENRNKTIREILAKRDEVCLVNPDGEYIAPEDKYEAHKYPSKLHLAVSIWLFNSKGQVLLQKRSNEKIVGAGWWANSVCGNVWPTETFFDCANRKLKAELGISGISLQPVFKFSYKAYGNEVYGEHEIDQVYIGLYEGNVVPNPEEVSKTTWVDFEELFSKVAVTEYVLAEQTLLLNDTELKTKTPTIKLELNNQEIYLAPWTVLMLKDSRLHDGYKSLII